MTPETNEASIRLDERLKVMEEMQKIIYEEVKKNERIVPFIGWRVNDRSVFEVTQAIEGRMLSLLPPVEHKYVHDSLK